jgi:tetratricopeptide (TPR) repeat protein
LREQGKLSEAYDEFVQIAESMADPLDKAGALLYAANTLEMSGQCEAATAKLSAVRILMEDYPKSERDERFAALQLFLDFEDANLFWLRGENLKAALGRFDAVLRTCTLPSRDPRARDFYDAIQTRRAFVLADLGRWKEALPILEGITSPLEYKEGISFYLGHCYLSALDYHRAEQKLTEALKLGGLSRSLEYRAHCELGQTYYELQDYAQARRELEKCVETADKSYLSDGMIWKYLEATCRRLGLKNEADNYAKLARPS